MKDNDLNTDELIAQMMADENEGAEKLTPVEYARLRGMKPQLVYYHIRAENIAAERCQCGRRIIDVAAADVFFKTKEGKR